MQRRGGTRQPAKGQRTLKPKARKAPTAEASAAGLQEQVAVLTRELKEARERQPATSKVLKVISSSPGELEPIFAAILENATRTCGAKFGTLYLCKGDALYAVAFHNAPPKFIEARKNRPLHPG